VKVETVYNSYYFPLHFFYIAALNIKNLKYAMKSGIHHYYRVSAYKVTTKFFDKGFVIEVSFPLR
jgi:hypothetical protein